MRNTKSLQRGMSRIEMLVVLVILAVVLSVALSAIQNARREARKVSCRNNLKQIGLALQNYHDVYNTFPPGYVADTNVKLEGNGLWSWSILILPYINQAPLYSRFFPGPHTASQSFHPHNWLSWNHPEGLPSLLVYRCPADVTPTWNNAENRLVKSIYHPRGSAVPTANYVAVNNTWGLLNARAPLTDLDGTSGAHGLFSKNSKIGVKQILDGTANTMMFGERAWQLVDHRSRKPYALKAAVTYMIDNDGKTRGNATQHTAGSSEGSDDGLVFGFGAAITKLNDVSEAAQARNACRQSFSSQHPGGAHFLMCDGSVRFISESIEHRTTSPDAPNDAPIDSLLEYLIGIDDGKTVSGF